MYKTSKNRLLRRLSSLGIVDSNDDVKENKKEKQQSADVERTLGAGLVSESREDDKSLVMLKNEDDDESREGTTSSSTSNCFANVPPPLSKDRWGEPAADSFWLRGATYLQDGIKVQAHAQPLFRLEAIEVVKTSPSSKDGTDLSQCGICGEPGQRVQLALANGTLPPFVFCVNIAMPTGPGDVITHKAMYFAANDLSVIDGSQQDEPSAQLLHKFIFCNDDKFRDGTFKLLPRVVKGNYLVRNATGKRPVVMGTKIRQRYFVTERYMEVYMDVASDRIARQATALGCGYGSTLVIDYCFILQGATEDHLPERVLGTARFENVDLMNDSRTLLAPVVDEGNITAGSD